MCPKVTNYDGTFRFIAIYAKNREEWVLTDYASILSGITSVTIFDTLSQDFIQYILNQTQITTISLQADKIKNIVELKKKSMLPTLKNLLYFGDLSENDKVEATNSGLNLIEFWGAILEGK